MKNKNVGYLIVGISVIIGVIISILTIGSAIDSIFEGSGNWLADLIFTFDF